MGYKFLVQKLSGFAKFDLDTKITKLQFFHLLEEASHDEVAEESQPAEGSMPAEASQDAVDTVVEVKK